MTESIFSKIIAGELPAHKVYESDRSIAIMTIQPVTPGHVLVISKNQSTDIFDIQKEDWADMNEVVRIIAPHIKEALDAEGLNIIMNNGPAAGQAVFHPHIHIVPRKEEDGHPKHILPVTEGDWEELGRIAQLIRDAQEKS